MTTNIDIIFPEDQQEGTEATVARWLVAEGDLVNAHDPVVEIETDKVVVEVAAPESGCISSIQIEADEEVNPGDVLCSLSPAGTETVHAEDDAEPSNAPKTKESNNDNSLRLSPAVKQRVIQHNLDVSDIDGSGRDGRVTLADVEKLLTTQDAETELGSDTITLAASEEGSSLVPHTKMRKRIAESMVDSLLHTAPHVTAVFEADLSAVVRNRKRNKDQFAQQGTPLTFTSYFVAATVAAIAKVPQVNSQWHDDHLEVFSHINVGIGTALDDQGLIVPVLHAAQNMRLEEIAAGLSDLTSRARSGKLTPADVRNGTFTISNHGVSGSLLATPIIINQPQSAILGVGKIEKRIKIKEIDGEDVISIRPMCYISLTIDHRVLDGFQTNAFLTEMVATLENWPA